MFQRLFKLFKLHKSAHKELLDDYLLLQGLASSLEKTLKELRQMHEGEVKQLMDQGKESSPTGRLGLEKTLFIKESLIPKIKKLSQETESRYLSFSETLPLIEPVSIIEKDELSKVINFLKELQSLLPNLEQIQNQRGVRERIIILERVVREITELGKKFHLAEKYTEKLIRKVEENEINPLVWDMYNNPKRHPQNPSSLIYKINKKGLRVLEKEANKINSCGDPNYRIVWRRWWRIHQKTEMDFTTPIKSPHINVTIKLGGGPKKDIHLIVSNSDFAYV